jgi:hypothetical protein
MTFAYLLFSGPEPSRLPPEVRLAGPGDLLELTLEKEDEPSLDWPVEGWTALSRCVPVQLSSDWNPLDYLTSRFGFQPIAPEATSKRFAKAAGLAPSIDGGPGRDAERRLLLALEGTIRLCNKDREYLYAVGAWGFSYEDNQTTREAARMAEQAGWALTTRRSGPPCDPEVDRATESDLSAIASAFDEVMDQADR